MSAPLSGVVVPLESVPDAVFAQKLAGEGVAIDPTSSEVLAPVGGRVTQLHRGGHALVITTDVGLEVLVHVGLDTVTLAGRGFTPLVAQGERVERGSLVLRFDADFVARNARSLLTEVVIMGGPGLRSFKLASGVVEAGRSALIEVELSHEPARELVHEVVPGPAEATYSGWVSLPNPAGLHARPAAVLAAEAKKYESSVRVVRGLDEANAKSVVAIMGLSTQRGDVVRVKAVGSDAQRAVEELSRLLAEGCGEKPGVDLARPAAAARLAPRGPVVEGELGGIAASPGLAIGRVLQLRQSPIAVGESGGSREEERARLEAALREAAGQLEAVRRTLPGGPEAAILDVHVALLGDPDLLDLTEARLAEGKSAAFAWREATTACAARLERADNPMLRQRAADIRDVGRRVLGLVAGVDAPRFDPPAGSILVAEELTPSETAALDREKVLGFCTTGGGATSHVGILARSLAIPAVCGIDAAALDLADGTEVVVDGTRGIVRVRPDETYLGEVRTRLERQEARRERDAAAARGPGTTSDGHRVEVAANVRNLDETLAAVAAGAEGVGLLRSELLFAGRTTPPSEEEQAAVYRAVAKALGRERPLVIRTLDVGGDKPLPFLDLPREQNPFLGVRGIRLSLDAPELFRAQLRAILRAAAAGRVHVMFPMVARLEELRAARAMLDEENETLSAKVGVGVMIEVPSAAAIAEVLAREVDFFSIGTNDLAQYTLAMDRGHPKLARYADALHPAVLRLVSMAVEGAHAHRRWVGVCGGLASDPVAVPVLVGLGVDELSVDVPSIAMIKATLARVGLEECKRLAAKALACGTAAEVRALVAPYAE